MCSWCPFLTSTENTHNHTLLKRRCSSNQITSAMSSEVMRIWAGESQRSGPRCEEIWRSQQHGWMIFVWRRAWNDLGNNRFGTTTREPLTVEMRWDDKVWQSAYVVRKVGKTNRVVDCIQRCWAHKGRKAGLEEHQNSCLAVTQFTSLALGRERETSHTKCCSKW